LDNKNLLVFRSLLDGNQCKPLLFSFGDANANETLCERGIQNSCIINSRGTSTGEGGMFAVADHIKIIASADAIDFGL
jgi:hypothetical protein